VLAGTSKGTYDSTDKCEFEVRETASHEMKNTLQILHFNLHQSMLVL
jgi:hypothetical protein